MKNIIISLLVSLQSTILPAIIICLIISSVAYLFTRKSNVKSIISRFLLIEYLLVLFSFRGIYNLTFQGFWEYITRGYYLAPQIIPFVTMTISHLILTILMYLPMGFLLPMVLNKKATFKTVILIAMISAAAIELLQGVIGRSTDINDVIGNVLGAALGYFIYKMVSTKAMVLINQR